VAATHTNSTMVMKWQEKRSEQDHYHT